MAHAWAWQRDVERLSQLAERADRIPLGSGALAGHPFGLDRDALASALEFSGGPTPNSLDAVSDRDFIAEVRAPPELGIILTGARAQFLFVGGLHGVHLSRWAEDLIIYGTREFGFVRFADAYATGARDDLPSAQRSDRGALRVLTT